MVEKALEIFKNIGILFFKWQNIPRSILILTKFTKFLQILIIC